ncbi:MAG: hypothetical protein ACE5GX_18690, partial [Thermoanaerobaculia bacterium]
ESPLRNPTRILADPNAPQAPPAVGVTTISVDSYVHEPLATYQLGATARALAESGIELQVMDRIVPRSVSSPPASPSPNAAGSALQAGPDGTPGDPPLAPPALTTNFGSVDYTTNIAEQAGFAYIPPDPHTAVGPNHLVNVVNAVIRFHQKNATGTVDFTDALDDFFSAEMPDTDTFDPKVRFDPFEGRFVVVTLEKEDDGAGGNPEVSEIFVAVSDDADPNGSWCTTTISANTMISGNDRWADYPGFAVDEEAVYITANMFGFSAVGGNSVGVRLWVIDKGVGSNGIYDCGTAIVSKLDPIVAGAFIVTTQPAQINGVAPAGVGTFIVGYSGLTGPPAEFVQSIRIDDPLGTPVFTLEFINVGDLEDFLSAFPDAPQSGPPLVIPIETNDRRALDAQWFDNSLWLTATIDPKTGDTDAGEATAHWWELNTAILGSTTLTQQGSIFGDDLTANLHTFYPSVAVNGINQVGFGYSGSAGSVFAGSYYTGRDPGDAAGSTQGTALLQGGAATYICTFCDPENRWGDYSGAATDPVDGCFWFYNEHAMSTGNALDCDPPIEDGRWATHNGKMCPLGACPADMFLADIDLTGTHTRKAGSAVRTGKSVAVKTGADVTLQALDKVVFFNGLTVENGADLAVVLKSNPCS